MLSCLILLVNLLTYYFGYIVPISNTILMQFQFIFPEPEYRAFRFGMLHLISGLARPIGAPIGAQLYKHGGYICVFATSLGGIILGAFYLIFRIQKYKWTPSKDAVRVNFFKKYQNIFSKEIVL